MSGDRKEEIVMAALALASERGLGGVTMDGIAEKVGVKKPSLYNHFSSKEALVEAMYKNLRSQARENQRIPWQMDYTELFRGKTAVEILEMAVMNYRKMNSDPDMRVFYRVIYSERCICAEAAKIMKEETERMIIATKQLFYAMQIHRLLNFIDPDEAAVSFAMTIHGLMEYEMDADNAGEEDAAPEQKEEKRTRRGMMKKYLTWFCEENGGAHEAE